MQIDVNGPGSDPKEQATALERRLDELARTDPREVAISNETLAKAARYFRAKGLHGRLSVVEMRLRNEDLAAAAKEADLEEDDLAAIITRIEESSDSDTLARLARDVARPKTTGHIDWTNPAIRRHYEREGLRPVTALQPDGTRGDGAEVVVAIPPHILLGQIERSAAPVVEVLERFGDADRGA